MCRVCREWSDIGDRLGGKQTVRLLGEPKMQMQVFPKLQLEKLRLMVKMFLMPQLEKLRFRLKVFPKPQLEKLKKVRDSRSRDTNHCFGEFYIGYLKPSVNFQRRNNVNFMPPFAGKNHMQ